MKIPQDKRKRTYELTYLMPSGLTAEEIKVVVDQVEKLIKKHKGTVTQSEDWGRKPLAYMIKHTGKRHTEAEYKFCKIEMDTTEVQGFSKGIQLMTQLLRHLLVLEENIDYQTAAVIEEVKPADEGIEAEVEETHA